MSQSPEAAPPHDGSQLVLGYEWRVKDWAMRSASNKRLGSPAFNCLGRRWCVHPATATARVCLWRRRDPPAGAMQSRSALLTACAAQAAQPEPSRRHKRGKHAHEHISRQLPRAAGEPAKTGAAVRIQLHLVRHGRARKLHLRGCVPCTVAQLAFADAARSRGRAQVHALGSHVVRLMFPRQACAAPADGWARDAGASLTLFRCPRCTTRTMVSCKTMTRCASASTCGSSRPLSTCFPPAIPRSFSSTRPWRR